MLVYKCFLSGGDTGMDVRTRRAIFYSRSLAHPLFPIISVFVLLCPSITLVMHTEVFSSALSPTHAPEGSMNMKRTYNIP